MSNLLMFLAIDPSAGVCSDESLLDLLRLIRFIIKILQIAVPIGLILMGTIDMGKAVIAGDEKKMKEAQKPFVKRIVSAVIVFIIPFIVNMVMNLILTNTDDSEKNNWKSCWNAASKFTGLDANDTLQ